MDSGTRNCLGVWNVNLKKRQKRTIIKTKKNILTANKGRDICFSG